MYNAAIERVINELVLITPQKKNSTLEINVLLLKLSLRRESFNNLKPLDPCIEIIKILVNEINLKDRIDRDVFVELTTEEKIFLNSIF
jgi:hypothetical protein